MSFACIEISLRCLSLSAFVVNLSAIFLAGTPPHISHEGIFLVTTAPAATIEPEPIFTGPTTVTPFPNHTSLPMTVGCPCLWFPCQMVLPTSLKVWSCLPTTQTFPANNTLSPTVKSVATSQYIPNCTLCPNLICAPGAKCVPFITLMNPLYSTFLNLNVKYSQLLNEQSTYLSANVVLFDPIRMFE